MPKKTVARSRKALRWKSREECLAARLAAARAELGIVEPARAEAIRTERRAKRERDPKSRNASARFCRLAADIAPALTELVALQKSFVVAERECDPFDLAYYPEERESAQREHEELVREMTGHLLSLRRVERWLRGYSRSDEAAALSSSTRRGAAIRESVIARALSAAELDDALAAAAGSSPNEVKVRELALGVILGGSEELPPAWRTMTVPQLIRHEMRASRLAWNRSLRRRPTRSVAPIAPGNNASVK